MINDRSTDHQSFLATDQVFEGATIRDRFLTAFILRNAGFFAEACTAECENQRGLFTGNDAASFSFQRPTERVVQPLAVSMIEDWFLTDGEDDM